MIRFTGAGIVEAPDALQVRWSRDPGAAHTALAPPSRAMAVDEVGANVEHFTLHQAGPRGRPVHTLVLSGVPPEPREPLELLRGIDRLGITRVVLHGDVDDALAALATEVVGRRPRRDRTLLVPLDDVAGLHDLVDEAEQIGVRRIVFAWGLDDLAAPEPGLVVPALVDALRGRTVSFAVKGLPACLLGPLAVHASRTRNRWYVDADHQRAQALLFVPDVIRWHKVDACRFCAVASSCDGLAERQVRHTPGVERLLRPLPLG